MEDLTILTIDVGMENLGICLMNSDYVPTVLERVSLRQTGDRTLVSGWTTDKMHKRVQAVFQALPLSRYIETADIVGVEMQSSQKMRYIEGLMAGKVQSEKYRAVCASVYKKAFNLCTHKHATNKKVAIEYCRPVLKAWNHWKHPNTTKDRRLGKLDDMADALLMGWYILFRQENQPLPDGCIAGDLDHLPETVSTLLNNKTNKYLGERKRKSTVLLDHEREIQEAIQSAQQQSLRREEAQSSSTAGGKRRRFKHTKANRKLLRELRKFNGPTLPIEDNGTTSPSSSPSPPKSSPHSQSSEHAIDPTPPRARRLLFNDCTQSSSGRTRSDPQSSSSRARDLARRILHREQRRIRNSQSSERSWISQLGPIEPYGSFGQGGSSQSTEGDGERSSRDDEGGKPAASSHRT